MIFHQSLRLAQLCSFHLNLGHFDLHFVLNVRFKVGNKFTLQTLEQKLFSFEVSSGSFSQQNFELFPLSLSIIVLSPANFLLPLYSFCWSQPRYSSFLLSSVRNFHHDSHNFLSKRDRPAPKTTYSIHAVRSAAKPVCLFPVFPP